MVPSLNPTGSGHRKLADVEGGVSDEEFVSDVDGEVIDRMVDVDVLS